MVEAVEDSKAVGEKEEVAEIEVIIEEVAEVEVIVEIIEEVAEVEMTEEVLVEVIEPVVTKLEAIVEILVLKEEVVDLAINLQVKVQEGEDVEIKS